MVAKNKGAYFCEKCGHEHKLNSKIGKKHKKYKKRGLRKEDMEDLNSRLDKIEKSLNRSKPKGEKKSSYYCKKCKRKHKKNTKIEKKHREYKKKTDVEKREEKLGFLKKASEIFKKSKKERKKKSEDIKKVEHVAKTVLVKDIMIRNPIHVKIKSDLSTAFEIMKKYKLESVIVTEDKIPVGILNYEEILSFFSSFVRMEKGSLEKNKKILDNLSEQEVSAAMIRCDATVSRTDSLEKAIKKLLVNKLSQIPVTDEYGKIIGIVTLENVFSFMAKESGKRGIISSSKIETGIDKLLDLVKTYGKLSAKEASKKLEVNEKMVEDWAKILEGYGLIEIDYSRIGTIKLIKKEKYFF